VPPGTIALSTRWKRKSCNPVIAHFLSYSYRKSDLDKEGERESEKKKRKRERQETEKTKKNNIAEKYVIAGLSPK